MLVLPGNLRRNYLLKNFFLDPLLFFLAILHFPSEPCFVLCVENWLVLQTALARPREHRADKLGRLHDQLLVIEAGNDSGAALCALNLCK